MAEKPLDGKAAAKLRDAGLGYREIGSVLANRTGRRTAYTPQSIGRAIKREKDHG